MKSCQGLSVRNLQECYNDAVYYRDEMRQLFITGRVTLRQRTLADQELLGDHQPYRRGKGKAQAHAQGTRGHRQHACRHLLRQFQRVPVTPRRVGHRSAVPGHAGAPPDGIPVPQGGPFLDITCDSDGRIDKFIDPQGMRTSLDLHPLVDGDEYYLGVFLVGAYQETLGDLHNLLGDTNVVSIRISEDGSYQFVREIRGDSVADILDYVEYDPRRILEDLREAAERAVREKRITPSERYKILQTFEDGLRGYTYFER